jgi:hypothetical protein
MDAGRFEIISVRFEALDRPVGPGWVIRISGIARHIQHVALPFMARVGEQSVQGLAVTAEGDKFEGFLERIPHAGDRLYVGYGTADLPTDIVYEPDVARPPPIA